MFFISLYLGTFARQQLPPGWSLPFSSSPRPGRTHGDALPMSWPSSRDTFRVHTARAQSLQHGAAARADRMTGSAAPRAILLVVDGLVQGLLQA
jgi:hypothetical protein